MTADALSHKFRRLGGFAGVPNPALHRLRHGVATHLVDQGNRSRRRLDSDTATRRRRFGTTRMRLSLMTKTLPMNSTRC